MSLKHGTFPRRHLKPLARYRVTNWPVYEAGRRRRDHTLWLERTALTGSSLQC